MHQWGGVTHGEPGEGNQVKHGGSSGGSGGSSRQSLQGNRLLETRRSACCNPPCSYCRLARATPGPAAKPGATGTAPASTHIVQRLGSLVASAGCTEKARAVTVRGSP